MMLLFTGNLTIIYYYCILFRRHKHQCSYPRVSTASIIGLLVSVSGQPNGTIHS